jgi:hypothetical protein
MTPPEIETATFRLVAQCLNQMRHRVPRNRVGWYQKLATTALFHIISYALSTNNPISRIYYPELQTAREETINK